VKRKAFLGSLAAIPMAIKGVIAGSPQPVVFYATPGPEQKQETWMVQVDAGGTVTTKKSGDSGYPPPDQGCVIVGIITIEATGVERGIQGCGPRLR